MSTIWHCFVVSVQPNLYSKSTRIAHISLYWVTMGTIWHWFCARGFSATKPLYHCKSTRIAHISLHWVTMDTIWHCFVVSVQLNLSITANPLDYSTLHILGHYGHNLTLFCGFCATKPLCHCKSTRIAHISLHVFTMGTICHFLWFQCNRTSLYHCKSTRVPHISLHCVTTQ